MAWLSGLTGKAEQLLNKLDQSAAQALTNDEGDFASGNTPRRSSSITTDFSADAASSHHPYTQSNKSPTSKLTEQHQNVDKSSSFVSRPIKQSGLSMKTTGKKASPLPQRKLSSGGTNQSNPAPPSVPQSVTTPTGKKKLDTDEALFDFLNSSDPVEASKKRATTPMSSARHSRQSSTSSTVSSKNGGKSTEAPPSTSGSSIVHIDSIGTGSERESPNSEPDITADVAMIAEAMLEQSPSNSVHSNQEIDTGDAQQKLSSLELENKLLQNEVASLNQEMAAVMQRSKTAQDGLEKTRQRLNEYNKSASMNDQLVRELQSRESDLMEALGAKDSQLAVLRVRLEEADKEVRRKAQSLGDLEDQRSRILQDHTDSSGMHSQALDSLKFKLTEVEAALQREQEAYKRAQKEAGDRQSKLEEEERSLAEALTASERRVNEEKTKANELMSQMRTAKNNLESAKQELTEYKDKATRILQSKERLIASLREGSGASGDALGVSNIEYDSVKQERDMFRDELQQSRMIVENMRVEIQDLESQLQLDSDSASEQIRSLEDNVMAEKRRREDAEQELLKQKQELQYSLEEIHKQKSAYQTRIIDRETQIDKLRQQLTNKSASSTTESELESRVRSLTESLIQKQTVLEALSTEKNSLTLQLERLEQQYKDIQAPSLRANTAVVHVHDDDEVRQRLPAFMRESPTDTEVTKKMKRAATNIDNVSIRLGIFFRRYPMARIFIILYMVLLHVWVMVVLLTYQPEMHGSDFGQPKPPEEHKP